MSNKYIAVESPDGRSKDKIKTEAAHERQQKRQDKINAYICVVCGQKLSKNSKNQKCQDCAAVHNQRSIKSHTKKYFRDNAGLEFDEMQVLLTQAINGDKPQKTVIGLRKILKALK